MNTTIEYDGAAGTVIRFTHRDFRAFDRMGRIVAGRTNLAEAMDALWLRHDALRELRRLAQACAEPGHEVPPVESWSTGGNGPTHRASGLRTR